MSAVPPSALQATPSGEDLGGFHGPVVQPIASMSPCTSMETILQPDARPQAQMHTHVVCVGAMQLVGLGWHPPL